MLTKDSTKENRYLKNNIPLILLGVLGLLAFIILLPHFYPSQGANLKIDQSQAIAKAAEFMQEKGYKLEDFNTRVIIGYNFNAFIYLQQRHKWHKTQELFQKESTKGLGFYWYVMWYKNLPKNTPYEFYEAWVSSTGEIIGFTHHLPLLFQWPEGREAHLSQEKASLITQAFLEKQGIDTSEFKPSPINSKKIEKRTNHTFKWVKELPHIGGKVNLTVIVKGDEVGDFKISYGVPAIANNEIMVLRSNLSFSAIISYILVFLFCLLLQLFFLRKYHEGEVSVKTAVVVFLITFGMLALESLLKFKINAMGTSLGELSNDGVGFVLLAILSLVIWPFFSIMAFSSWSVGESLGRERFNKKFSALDSLFNKKWFTLNFASSSLNGYFAGFAGLGLIALLTVSSMAVFNTRAVVGNYKTISTFLPFMVPVLAALSSALLGELSFRLFANLFIFKLLKRRDLSLIISSLLWTVYAVGFWDIGIRLIPMVVDWAIIYIIGLMLGYIFWKFDILTAIVAHMTIIGVMQAVPMLTSPAPGIFYHALAALLLLFAPVILIVRGFLKHQVFAFEADLTPEHIKRITERVRMAKELEIARQVQMRLLPGSPPEIEGFEIDGICIPANEVGGDYYDFIHIDDAKLGVVIGDVSGKGVPAAIYMTLTKGVIQSQAENEISPKEVLTRVNRSLYTMMDTKSFVTLFFAVIDSDNKTLTYSRAGHNPLLYFQENTAKMMTLKPDGIALGIEKGNIFDVTIKTGHLQLHKGDMVVFYTDGFSEAMNKNLDQYSENRLGEIIGANRDKSVCQIIDAVIQDVQLFVKGYPQHDDMTMVIVKAL
jgi:phosphoserine phosphatase RsbU/P